MERVRCNQTFLRRRFARQSSAYQDPINLIGCSMIFCEVGAGKGDLSHIARSGYMSENRRARPQKLIAVHTCTNRRVRQHPLSCSRTIKRQIKTIMERTPEGFDAQVNAAIQDL